MNSLSAAQAMSTVSSFDWGYGVGFGVGGGGGGGGGGIEEEEDNLMSSLSSAAGLRGGPGGLRPLPPPHHAR